MDYAEFVDFLYNNCQHETIYDDSDGRPILVIRVLDAFEMYNKMERMKNDDAKGTK